MLASVAFFSLVSVAFSAGATVNSPTGLTTCEPSLLSWTGGVPPYFLTVLPGSQPAAAPLLTLLSSSAATSYTWNVNLAAGTSITLAIKDSTGAINYSQASTIAAGPSTACVGLAASVAPGTAAGTTAAVAPVGASSAAPAASAASSSAASSGASTAATTSASAAASSVKAAGAAQLAVGSLVGFAGVVGLLL